MQSLKHRKVWKGIIGFLLLAGVAYFYRVPLFVRCLRNDTCARLSVPVLKWYLGPEGYAMFHGIRQGLGAAPLEIGKGIGRFTFKTIPNLTLTVPRSYISFMPNEPDGETDALNLAFYLPGLVGGSLPWVLFSYPEARDPKPYCPPGAASCLLWRPPSKEALDAVKIEVFLNEKSTKIKCWGGRGWHDGECLGSEFALFQSSISSFQGNTPEREAYWRCRDTLTSEQKSFDDQQEMLCGPFPISTIRRLEHGQWDAETQLIKYAGTRNIEIHGKIYEDVIYLKPEADPSNPREWLVCKGGLCEQHYFREGFWVKIRFERYWAAQHTKIRAQVDQKLDDFIHKRGE